MLGRPAIEKHTLIILFICYARSFLTILFPGMLSRTALEKRTLTILFIYYARSFCNREAYINNTVHLICWVVLQ